MTSYTRVVSVIGAAVLMAAVSGCAAKSLKQARAADELREYDLAVAEYANVLRTDPDNTEARLGLERSRLRASDAHFLRGRRLVGQGRLEDALIELQLAVELNPVNADAERELRTVRIALRAKLSAPPEGQTRLESVLARARDVMPVEHELPTVNLPGQILTGRTTTSRDLYLLIGKLANLSVTFDSQFREVPAQVSLMSSMTLRQALDAVAQSTTTFYQVTSPGAIIVVPDTPQKRREYVQEVIGTIFLENADLKETTDALRVVGDMRAIAAVTGLNAISVRDTPERFLAARRLVAAFDKARPEIVVDVEVLEVDRNRLREYGVQPATPGSAGIEGSFDVNREGLTLQDLRSLTAADILTTNIPALYYRLIKTDDRTRTLANPHIRILDGVQASANFGEDVPVPRTTITPITQGGAEIQPQTTFDYRTIGVNIGITPRTHPNDEVTMALTIELSNLAGAGFDGLPKFGRRSVQTTIRLRDGQTNILAGLIRDDERTLKESVPGLGDIPVLGHLFARTRREAAQTDVVIMLTPHIIRVLDVSEEDLRPFRIPREGSGIAGLEAPVVPPPPIRGGGGGPIGSVAAGRPASLPVEPGMPSGSLPTAPLTAPAKVIKN